MTDLEIMQILTSDLDIFEKGKAFRRAIDAMKPSALSAKPTKERKKREPRKPRPASELFEAPETQQ